MQQEPIHTAARALKAQLAQQSVARNDLFRFAKDYAVTRGLINEALLLQLRYFSAKDGDRVELDAAFAGMIDRIVADHEQLTGSDLALQEQQKKEQARAVSEMLQPEKETVIELKELTKKYRRGNFRLAPLDLQFHLGEITGIVGANANGKSTLTRMIVGELLKSGGRIYFPYFNKGRRHELPWGEVKHRIAYIPQEIPHWEGGLKETLYYEAASHGIKGKDCEREVEFILARLDLTEDAETKTWKELSGGFRLRFALARALVWKPSLLVLDEPLANLDMASQQIILSDLRNLAHSFRHPMCVLITSQHIHEIENVADRLLLLDNGQLRYTGAPGFFGMDNDFNLYEFSSTLSLEELKNALPADLYQRLEEKGFYYLMRTDKSVGEHEFMTAISKSGAPLSYFRDISHSVKQIFYETRDSL